MPSENPITETQSTEPDAPMDSNDVFAANADAHVDGQVAYAESYLPEGVLDLTGHGFADAPPVDSAEQVTNDLQELTLVPKEGEVAAPKLSAYDAAMQGTVTGNIETGDFSLQPKESEVSVSIEGGAEVSPAVLGEKIGDIIEGAGATVPEELRAKSPEELAELKAEAVIAASEVLKLTPEQQETAERGLANIGYTVEQSKNKVMGKAFAWVSQKFGDENLADTKGAKGMVGRYLAAFAGTYKERNEDLDRKMDLIEETRKEKGSSTKMQKLGQAMQVTGGVLRWGRIIKEGASWTVAAPLRIGQIVATTLETGTRVAKEARLKNADVIEQTRISDENLNTEERTTAWETYQKEHADDVGLVADTPENRAMASHEFTVNKAADEAWELYARAEQKHKLDPKNEGKGGVSAEDLKRSYSEGLPKDILKRLEENPIPGDGSNIMQRLFRKHLELEAGQMQKKIEAIDTNPNLTPEAKEKARERYMDQWGNGKTLKDFDRMLTQQGSVDTIAMSMRYATGAAKVASLALMAGTVHAVWNKAADWLSSDHSVPEGAVGTMAMEDGMLTSGFAPASGTQVFEPIESNAETQIGDTDILIAGGKLPATETMLGDTDILSAGGVTEATQAASSMESSGKILEVVQGNTLSRMLSEKSGLSPAETYRTLMTMNAGQLKEMGIRPEDIEKFGAKAIDHIYPGQKINLSIFEDALKKGGGNFNQSLYELSGKGVAPSPIKETVQVFPNSGVAPAAGEELTPPFVPVDSGERDTATIVEEARQPTPTISTRAAEVPRAAAFAEESVAQKPKPQFETMRVAAKEVPPELLSDKERTAQMIRDSYVNSPGQRAQIAKVLGVSENQLNKQFGIVEPVARPRAGFQERVTGLRQTIEKPSAAEVLEARANVSGRAHTAAMERINAQEQLRYSDIDEAYRKKVADLAVAKDNAMANSNVKSINKGIGVGAKILQGKNQNISSILINEGSARLQGGISAENKYAQALQEAQSRYESDMKKAQGTFEVLRARAETAESLKLSKLEDAAARAGVSPVTTRPGASVEQFQHHATTMQNQIPRTPTGGQLNNLSSET